MTLYSDCKLPSPATCVLRTCMSKFVCVWYLEGPVYSSNERVLELTGSEGQRLTIICTANGSSPIAYEFFKVCFCISRGNNIRSDMIV